jgi:uncharacterized protein YraI
LSVSATGVFAQSGALTYGSGSIGVLDATAPLAFYTFNGAEGDLVTVRVIGVSPGLLPTVSVNNPAQQQLATSSGDPFGAGGDARVDLRLPETGAYVVLVGSQDATTGNVLIRVDGVQTPPAIPVVEPAATASITPESGIQAFSFAANPTDPTQLSIAGDIGYTAWVVSGEGKLVAILNGDDLLGGVIELPPGEGGYEVIMIPAPESWGTLIVSTSATAAGQPSTGGTTTTGDTTSQPPSDVCTVSPGPGGANVRSGPGTNYNVIGNLAPNTSAVVTGVYNGWYTVGGYGLNPGWVAGSVTTLNGPCDNIPPATDPGPPVPISTDEVSPSGDQQTGPSPTPPPTDTGGQQQPTQPPPPTEPQVQTAPPDNNPHNWAVHRDNGGTFSEVISYPDGDTSDRITVTVNLAQSGPDCSRNVHITLNCSGTGSSNVSFTRGSPNAQRFTCGQTITFRFAANFAVEDYYVFIDGGSASYVNYTLTATTSPG